MAFTFNFDIPLQTEETNDKENKDGNAKDVDLKCSDASATDPTKTKNAIEHEPLLDPLSHIENWVPEIITVGALPPLLCLNESVFEKTAPEREDSDEILAKTLNQNSDLITGVYEGGLKIWECTYDLLEYIDDEGETFTGKRVLDLGCGAGLLGILALKRGAIKVDFQDYNSTVIEQLTVPNVFLNCEDDDETEEQNSSPLSKRKALNTSHKLLDHCGFFSGDWNSFLTLMRNKTSSPKYDIIFTSETIYNTDYYSSLHSVFCGLLAEDGIVYLATKSHYFGVGGGLHLFEKFVEQNKVFQTKYLKDVKQGLKRHVVSLTFKK
ncbi:histidine protein methyltransferase 1 homolog [Rhinichthys klamathensis goyatoka]|uniref:histidine protein methyltransferase 1 homolog n=1 Tax=Rhinichthys klamathensis goyatoka TaxID=3034132 RepID=UPI0024B5A2F5|nr:histidine protein methyltransferase 1 homolog [Rhinichthys klamathensis goyatoka]